MKENRELTEREKDELIKAYTTEFASVDKLEKRFGIPISVVYYILGQKGIPIRKYSGFGRKASTAWNEERRVPSSIWALFPLIITRDFFAGVDKKDVVYKFFKSSKADGRCYIELRKKNGE